MSGTVLQGWLAGGEEVLADWGLGGTVVGRAQKKAQAYPASTTLHM